MSVVGIGGVFFRADDPKALQAWYHVQLGIAVDFASPWNQQAGPMLFVPFKRDTDYFPAGKQYMINFRVTEIEAMIARLRKAGIAVTTKAEWDSPQTGKFARIHDPEGNPIELWEPPSKEG